MILKPLSLDISLPSQDNQNDIEFDITEYLIDLSKPLVYTEPILYFEVNGYTLPVFRQQGISLIQGLEKSRKSMLIQVITATIAGGGNFINGCLFKSYYKKNDVLIIDTEQSEEDCRDALTAINRMTHNDNKVKYYTVKALGKKEIFFLIEKHLREHPNCGFIVFDNVKDMVRDMNDTAGATEFANFIKQTTVKYDVHITCVLHENPSDFGKASPKAGGHIGTTLSQKAETVFSAKQDPEIDDRSIVYNIRARKKKIRPFFITFDEENNVPKIFLEDYNAPKKPRPQL